MPTTILPSSAAAFTPRARPVVVLEKKKVPWLIETSKRVKQPRRPLNNLKQQTSYLIKKLASESAIWVLCSVMLENTLGMVHIEPWCSVMSESRLWMIHIVAYVVHVDMVSQRKEVAFKLTEETINKLRRFYGLLARFVYLWLLRCPAFASSCLWSLPFNESLLQIAIGNSRWKAEAAFLFFLAFATWVACSLG